METRKMKVELSWNGTDNEMPPFCINSIDEKSKEMKQGY